MIRTTRSLRQDRFRIAVRKKRRHIELAGLQIISAAPAIYHAGLHGLAAFDVGVPRNADEEIPVLAPIDTEPAIVFLSPLQEIRRNVILRVLLEILLDRYRAVRRFLGVLLFDVVTRGRCRRLHGGRAIAADVDTADNEQADQRCSSLHFLALLTRSLG